ncbi:MAG TPA: hypothetical protein DD761_02140, partial [Cyanobacteria bacterium UBA11691]|nr:hypothetical protein [Cyanobacteria bacterium UBA11691]
GWHNNHHAFPYSARFSMNWWQVDFSWWVIALLQRLGLVWDVKFPSDQDIERKQQENAVLAN